MFGSEVFIFYIQIFFDVSRIGCPSEMFFANKSVEEPIVSDKERHGGKAR